MKLQLAQVRSFLVAGALVAGTTLAAPSAFAADGTEDLIRQGIELRRKGDDIRAEGYFKLAYKAAQTPRSAAQLGLVELALDKHLEANFYLTEALESDDAWVQKSHSVLEDGRTRARSHLGEVDLVGVPAGATVSVGSRTPVAVPDDGRIWLLPGDTSLTIEAGKTFSEKRSVTAAVGAKVKVTFEAPPPAVSPSPAAAPPVAPLPPQSVGSPTVVDQPNDRSPGRSLRIAGAITSGVGLAAIVGGLVLRSIATSKYEAVAHATPTQRFSDGDLDYQTYDKAGVGLLVGGGVVVAAGATMFLVGRHERVASSSGDSVLNVTVGPSSVAVAGSF
jgi:hypothetical protein